MAMDVKIPIIAVLGRKNSGKTTIAERIVSALIKKGFKVAAAKHISKKGFSMDREGKDTWRYSAAGATPLIAVSDSETVIKLTKRPDAASLDWMVGVSAVNGANVLVIEGFSFFALKNRTVGKIICVRSMEEYEEYRKEAEGEVIAYCSFSPLGGSVLEIDNDLETIVDGTVEYALKMKKILGILDALPGLDCRKCGKASCLELARAIHAGEARLEDCVPLRLKPKLKTRLLIEGAEVPIQPFVSEVIRRSVLGMISALKGIEISGEEKIRIEVSE
jgi:molybdopterin-guanine dinucleotide biosynthesis protein B